MADYVEINRDWRPVVASWPVETRREFAREADRLEAAGWTNRMTAEYLAYETIRERRILESFAGVASGRDEGTAQGDGG